MSDSIEQTRPIIMRKNPASRWGLGVMTEDPLTGGITLKLRDFFTGSARQFGVPSNASLVHFLNKDALSPFAYSVFSANPTRLSHFSAEDNRPLFTTTVLEAEGNIYPCKLRHDFPDGASVVTERQDQVQQRKILGFSMGEKKVYSDAFVPEDGKASRPLLHPANVSGYYFRDFLTPKGGW